MCGIIGFLEPAGRRSGEEMRTHAERMACAIRHRGPDDAGVWVDPAIGIALGSRRLAVVDLSRQGHQPMRSADGRYVIAYNGEIYNFRALREELLACGHRFCSRCDTEVLLAAIVEWGARGALERVNGMFAFALWDCAERELTLVRDRLGKKPVYYGSMRSAWLFGSELKALAAHPAMTRSIDRRALADYMRHGSMPAPRTIYTAVRQLPPGTLVRISGTGTCSEPERYWSIERAALAGLERPFEGTVDDALDGLEAVLGDAVAARLVADVPLGAFLSGGTDSSLVAALMQSRGAGRTRTFTIGFEESGYDEAPAARSVARALGTDHTAVYVSPSEALDVIPRLPSIYDEPFADSSQIPTYLVSAMARRDVTVCLSGDGGDEMFGGYGRYALTERIWRLTGRAPDLLRPAAGRLTALAATLADRGPRSRTGERAAPYGDRLERLAGMLRDRSAAELYERVVSVWEPGEQVVVGGTSPNHAGSGHELRDAPLVSQLMLRDAARYLPDDVLTKVDRASMAVSLEVRNPLLDHRVVEFAWRLPPALRTRHGEPKWILRELLRRYIPAPLVDRPKAGFDLPIGAWLRGPLRDWAEELLDERRLRSDGYLHPEPIRARWRQHLSGRRNCEHKLWAVLMFQAWLETQPR